MRKKIVTAVVLCRNEVDYIERCIRSIASFDKPDDVDCEILVVDGLSEDGTKDILAKLQMEFRQVRVVSNPQKTTPCAFNTAIRESRGELLLIFSSHAEYSKNYLLESIETIDRTGAANAGGVFITQQNGDSYGASVVQALTTHKFGVGSSFRTDMNECEADTVSYGCYRRSVFDKVGFFDERLARAQDYEMNARIRRDGGMIWKNPRIQVYYYNQKSVFKFLQKQIVWEAPYNAYMWYLAPYTFTPRHAITGVFSFGVLAGGGVALCVPWIAWPYVMVMALYVLLSVGAAAQQAIRYKKVMHVVVLPMCFFLYHFLHGVGIWWGLFRLVTGSAPVQKIREPWKGAGRFRAWRADVIKERSQ